MGNIINTAPCRFCGQMVQIDSEEKLTQPQAEEQATMSCTCEQAVEYQKEKQRKEKAMQNVAALFGEAAAPEKRCGEGIVKILKAAVEEIYTGGQWGDKHGQQSGHYKRRIRRTQADRGQRNHRDAGVV